MFSKESLKFVYCQCICLRSCCAKSSWNNLSTILTIKDWSKEGSSLLVLIHSHRLKQKIASHIKLNYMALYFHYSSIPLYYCSWITLFSMGSGLWLLNLAHFTQELPLIRLELRAELLWLTLQTSTVAECHRLFSYYKGDIVCLNSQNWADDSRSHPHWASQPWGGSSPWPGATSCHYTDLAGLPPSTAPLPSVHSFPTSQAPHSRTLGNQNCGNYSFSVCASFLNLPAALGACSGKVSR